MADQAYDPLAKLLERCTVRITHNGQTGTGFFVAPGVILTCAHVLRETYASKQGVEFWWSGRRFVGSLESVLPTPCPDDLIFPDIAVIYHQLGETPCVLLGGEYKEADPLSSWGYSKLAVGGESLSGKCEGDRNCGPDATTRLIKFKDTQVLPGISGSPLLNRRTGAVCGIVKRTRDPDYPTGGLAIRVELLSELLPDLIRQNNDYHRIHREWRAAQSDGKTLQLESTSLLDGPKFVDRETQEREFQDFLERARSRRPRAAQVYLLPSMEVDCPRFFTDRLHEDTVERFARRLSGINRAHVDRIIVTKEPRYQSAEVLRRDLCADLYAEFDLDYSEMSATPLSKIDRLGLPTFVLIEQFVRTDCAAKLIKAILPWYFNSFWAEFESYAHVLVFLHLVSPAPERSWLQRLGSSPAKFSRSYLELDDYLRLILPRGEGNIADGTADSLTSDSNRAELLGAPVKRLSTLEPIDVEDIKTWLRRLMILPHEVEPTARKLVAEIRRKHRSESRLSYAYRVLDDYFVEYTESTKRGRLRTHERAT